VKLYIAARQPAVSVIEPFGTGAGQEEVSVIAYHAPSVIGVALSGEAARLAESLRDPEDDDCRALMSGHAYAHHVTGSQDGDTSDHLVHEGMLKATHLLRHIQTRLVRLTGSWWKLEYGVASFDGEMVATMLQRAAEWSREDRRMMLQLRKISEVREADLQLHGSFEDRLGEDVAEILSRSALVGYRSDVVQIDLVDGDRWREVASLVRDGFRVFDSYPLSMMAGGDLLELDVTPPSEEMELSIEALAAYLTGVTSELPGGMSWAYRSLVSPPNTRSPAWRKIVLRMSSPASAPLLSHKDIVEGLSLSTIVYPPFCGSKDVSVHRDGPCLEARK